MTTGVNDDLNKSEDAFNSLLLNPLKDTAVAAIFTAEPWMKIWPISAIVNFVADQVAGKIYSGTKELVDISAIKFLNTEHQSEFDKASLTLKIVAHDKGVDSDEFKKALADEKTAFAKFVQYSK